MNNMRGIEFHRVFEGLKARDVIARPEGPGLGGVIILSPVRAKRPLSRPYRAVDDGERETQGFTLGYNITGFQPGHAALDAESAEVLGNIKALL